MADASTFNRNLRDVFRQSRTKIQENCIALIADAILLFEDERSPAACFLAMTAIEEAGKLTVLRFFAHKRAQELGIPELPTGDLRELTDFLRDHTDKAAQAAVWSLWINAGADRRQGIHPTSGMHRTSGIILLARSSTWMKLRNDCLYVDTNLVKPSTCNPRESISKAHAYYMICMAYEIVAEQAEAAIENSLISFRFRQDTLTALEKFMRKWEGKVDLNKLDFLADPKPLRRRANGMGS